MVEVFRTNIDCHEIAGALVVELQSLYPSATVNFDLDDCDRILRVKGDSIHPPDVICHLEGRGYNCEVLE